MLISFYNYCTTLTQNLIKLSVINSSNIVLKIDIITRQEMFLYEITKFVKM